MPSENALADTCLGFWNSACNTTVSNLENEGESLELLTVFLVILKVWTTSKGYGNPCGVFSHIYYLYLVINSQNLHPISVSLNFCVGSNISAKFSLSFLGEINPKDSKFFSYFCTIE